MTDLNTTAATIEALLQQEQNTTITSRADIGAHKERRKELWGHIYDLDMYVHKLRDDYRGLPDLPNTEHMDWAESILSMRNLAVLVLDTTGLNEREDDIIRIYAQSQNGVLLDQFVKPMRVADANTAYTGIKDDQLIDAPTLAEAWEAIIKPALSGQFIVSYGLSFVEKMLKGNIENYGLSRLPFRGEDLMKRVRDYFLIGDYNGIKLHEACERIGKPFPYHPPTADIRASGILNLLLAMSQGVTSAPAATPQAEITSDTDLGSLDGHPF